jgi:hypothetical protein
MPQYCIDGDTLAFSFMISLTTVAIDEPANSPSEFVLYQNAPNPFNPITNIWFELPVIANVDLDVISISGTHVSTLVSGNMHAGVHRATWNGTDMNGEKVSTGIYFLLLRISENIQTRKMVLLE